MNGANDVQQDMIADKADLMAENEQLRETLRRIKRTAEMSSGIMRDPKRTGGWDGAERVAAQFDRIAETASI